MHLERWHRLIHRHSGSKAARTRRRVSATTRRIPRSERARVAQSSKGKLLLKLKGPNFFGRMRVGGPEETSTHAVSPGRFSRSAETGTLRELELELVPCGLLSENTDL